MGKSLGEGRAGAGEAEGIGSEESDRVRQRRAYD